ncbi:WD repeat-containing protein 54-like isoform X2 [Daktulosphaira vitifoliae]|uniref:WD repeat-containing protein 54-like isoform X2 n=1 Tax=Daktulosphaira vitifoliae TaxID=58002 RepID=UPI0021A9BA71|nr:WD repeat-containing protein 54-like isoform X2 [Daktulosphaira vitifoliae]
MIYSKEKIILFKGSASAITNNISIKLGKDKKSFDFAVIDRQKIHIVSTDSLENGQCLNAKSDVGWFTLGYMNCLVITCIEGLIIYNCDENFNCVYTHNCEDKSTKEIFAKGIATLDCTYLCVGNSNGSIRVFGPDQEGKITFLDRKLLHSMPIADMASLQNNLVSCDESGCCVLSKFENRELVLQARTECFGGFSCTTTVISKNIIAVGYTNGMIRIFDKASRISIDDNEDKLPLSIQISAHARSVTSISFAKDADLLLSVSEDSWIRVWKSSSGIFSLTFCCMREDALLMGCQFISRNGSKFCTTSYNTPYITCYAQDHE